MTGQLPTEAKQNIPAPVLKFKREYQAPPTRSPLADWSEGTSGKVFAVLEKRGAKENKTVAVKDQLKDRETFTYDGKDAHIIKHAYGGVGDGKMTIESYVESHEYKRQPWWKEAIDAVGEHFEILPAPVTIVAAEAGILHVEEIFDPERFLVAHAQKLAHLSEGAREANLGAISDTIITEVARFTTDYAVYLRDGCLRMVPKTQEAKASLTTDNAAYDRAKLALIEVAKTLPQKLQALNLTA